MAIIKQETAPTPPKPGSFEEYVHANQRMVKAISESTNFIKSNQDKEKLKARIEGVDKLIMDHKEYLKERAARVRWVFAA